MEQADLTVSAAPPPVTPPEPKVFGVMDGEEFRVKVKFGKAVAGYVQERIWSDDQSIRRYKNGNVDLEFSANSWREVRSGVLSFGSNAKVIYPKELRAEVVEEAQTILGMLIDL
ncbi:WYL domain-containing protein [Pseudodesulfovibrio methanolicus]|uniref:WYL domain-containing protein n=1 Tax=Pseudodesulfovibrio methanolicus TaxID=3126690 RepID=A0ABZ2J156_9BACT